MRKFSRVLSTALVFVIAVAPLSAGNPTEGPEFQVNTYTTLGQLRPAVAVDAAGNFVVVWDSFQQDGDERGVFGQRYDAAGSPLGAEFVVNSTTTGGQFSPAVAADPAGNFLVTWQSDGQDGSDTGVFGQFYDASGVPVGDEFQVNTHTADGQHRSAVAADGSGQSIVVWDSFGQDGPDEGIFGQRFDSLGSPVGSEFQINSYTTDDQFGPTVAADAAGNFMAVWTSFDQDGSGRGVYGQLFDSSGNPVGVEFPVNSHTGNAQFDPSVGVDGSGNFLVAWSSADQDGSSAGVFARRLGSDLTEFQVNTWTSNNQDSPAVAVTGVSGDFVIVWQSDAHQDGSLGGIFGQRFLNPDLFEDGFESGDTSAWSNVVP